MNASAAPGLSLAMLVAGFGIPVMAAMNSDLGQRIGTPATALAGFLVGALITAAVAGVTGGISLSAVRAAPGHLYLAGALVAYYALAITFIAPRIGVGNAVFLVLVGQIAAAATIDHFGLLNVPRTPVDLKRLGGILLMVAGVYLARRPAI